MEYKSEENDAPKPHGSFVFRCSRCDVEREGLTPEDIADILTQHSNAIGCRPHISRGLS